MGVSTVPNFGHENQPLYNQFGSGTATVGASAGQLPATACGLVCFRSRSTNTSRITLGGSNAVADGSGFTLDAGDVTPWIPVDRLDRIWAIAAGAGQVLEYIYL